jgi:hypothetical protein
MANLSGISNQTLIGRLLRAPLAKWNYRVTSLDGQPVESTDELIAYPQNE